MFKRISYYLPTLGQSWLIVLIFLFGGGILAAVIAAPLISIFPNFQEWQNLVIYPLSFIPVVIFIYFMIRDRWQKGAIVVYRRKFLIDKTTQANNDNIPATEEPVSTTIPTTIKEVMQIVPDSEIEASLPNIPINRANFGKLGIPLTFILLIPLTLSLSIIVEPIMNWWEMPDWIKNLFESLMTGNIVAATLTVAVMAPLLEEWMCRGIIMRGLMYHTGPIIAILWSAFIFGFMHFNPWQGVPAFFLGILFGWIYWRTRSLWAPIFMHFVNNGTSVLLTILYPNLPMDFTLRDMIPGSQYFIVYIAAIVISVAIILLMHKKYDKPIIPDKVPADT